MMALIMLTLVSVVLLSYYFLYYLPLQRMKRLASNAQALGYKVKLLPLTFMGYYLQKYFTQDDGNLNIFKEEWSKFDIVVGNLFTREAIMVSNPELIKDVLNQTTKFIKSPFVTEVYHDLASGGIVFSQWQAWRRKRRIISSVFHFNFLNDIIPEIQQEIKHQFSQIDKKIGQGNYSMDMKKILSQIMSNVVAKCFFGTEMKEYLIEGKPYCDYYVDFLDEIGQFITSWEHVLLRMNGYKFGLTQRSRQLRRKNELLKSIARQITTKQVEKIMSKKEKKKNILTALYENGLLNLQAKQNPEQYTLDEVVSEFFSFFGAGTDTTTNTLNVALHYLSQSPSFAQKIADEYKTAKTLKLNPGDEIKQLKLGQDIFNECLRINGPASIIFNRLCVENVKIGILDLPKSVTVTVSPLLAHYNQNTFQEPFKFMPQRWLKKDKLQPFSFIPFSGGERNCIGQYLAKIQFKLILAQICSKYHFKALNPLKMKAKFVYAAVSGDFELKQRNQNQINKQQSPSLPC